MNNIHHISMFIQRQAHAKKCEQQQVRPSRLVLTPTFSREQQQHLHVFCEEATKAMLTDTAASICHLKDEPLTTRIAWTRWICKHIQHFGDYNVSLLLPCQCLR